jgi:hypothetical protein
VLFQKCVTGKDELDAAFEILMKWFSLTGTRRDAGRLLGGQGYFIIVGDYVVFRFFTRPAERIDKELTPRGRFNQKETIPLNKLHNPRSTTR